mgnify:CR=1 FL=1
MIRKLTLKKEREHETNEASIAGNVMRDLIAHVTNDNLIGRKIKSGELRKNGRTAVEMPGYVHHDHYRDGALHNGVA